MAEKLKIPQVMDDAAKNITLAYKKLQNNGKSFRSPEINKKSNDSWLSKTKTEAFLFAKIQWNNEKQEQHIDSLEKLNRAILDQKQGESKRHRNVVFILILIFGLAAISVFLFWMYTYKQNEILHQKELSRISMLRLQNIRNRVSPHFIFNILNHEINTVENKEKYQEMMGLVVFLRRSLEIAEQIL